ncbi:hypothetical protein P153DRAFT_371729 [Dothidotthia symphoricarpi CBS 119687]|uniref:Uncharacterized protein n=1 Tax=Dothidotthia symphoricarpi CBS 119687 TaxID=1392245 RepID=A0A6A5ZUT0_9PLEO|nr:uncharacterized protein P153DRAFT_371729 [Dothidotthia symphoricarpi CBS 119687]KAF2123410.1 hypothetical protein P153DRAFT_371729 [Dothidotthia symphoricarpi CBS 119687]
MLRITRETKTKTPAPLHCANAGRILHTKPELSAPTSGRAVDAPRGLSAPTIASAQHLTPTCR